MNKLASVLLTVIGTVYCAPYNLRIQHVLRGALQDLNNAVESYCPLYMITPPIGACKEKINEDSINITLNSTDFLGLLSNASRQLKVAKMDVCVEEIFATQWSPCVCCPDDNIGDISALTATTKMGNLINTITNLQGVNHTTEVDCQIPSDNDSNFIMEIFAYTKKVLEEFIRD